MLLSLLLRLLFLCHALYVIKLWLSFNNAAWIYRRTDQSTVEGVHGDPTAASPHKGLAVEKAVLDELLQIVRSLQES